MLKVGITGGIGSGKTTVCQVFHTLGIPVFNADAAARNLLATDKKLIANIKALLGEESYTGNTPNREKIASIVFQHPEKLQQLNALVHPAVVEDGIKWMKQQTTPYAIKEAAIFFESRSHTDMDVMIGVYAPEEIRIKRTVQRGGISETDVKQRIASQMNEDEKMKRCDYVITNDGNTAIIPQVMHMHRILLDKAGVL